MTGNSVDTEIILVLFVPLSIVSIHCDEDYGKSGLVKDESVWYRYRYVTFKMVLFLRRIES